MKTIKDEVTRADIDKATQGRASLYGALLNPMNSFLYKKGIPLPDVSCRGNSFGQIVLHSVKEVESGKISSARALARETPLLAANSALHLATALVNAVQADMRYKTGLGTNTGSTVARNLSLGMVSFMGAVGTCFASGAAASAAAANEKSDYQTGKRFGH